MAWMMDEYSKLVGVYSPGSFTGKPLTSGGSKGRGRATAQGGVYVLQKIMELRGETLAGKKVILQGAGNAGLTMAEILIDLGASVVAISDSRGEIYNPKGLDIKKISAIKETDGAVQDYQYAEKIGASEVLTKACDILIPAALENQITKENAPSISAKIILELANGPTTPEADEILEKK